MRIPVHSCAHIWRRAHFPGLACHLEHAAELQLTGPQTMSVCIMRACPAAGALCWPFMRLAAHGIASILFFHHALMLQGRFALHYARTSGGVRPLLAFRTAGGALIPALADAPALSHEQVRERFARLHRLPMAGVGLGSRAQRGALDPAAGAKAAGAAVADGGAADQGLPVGPSPSPDPEGVSAAGAHKRGRDTAAAAAVQEMQTLPADGLLAGELASCAAWSTG